MPGPRRDDDYGGGGGGRGGGGGDYPETIPEEEEEETPPTEPPPEEPPPEAPPEAPPSPDEGPEEPPEEPPSTPPGPAEPEPAETGGVLPGFGQPGTESAMTYGPQQLFRSLPQFQSKMEGMRIAPEAPLGGVVGGAGAGEEAGRGGLDEEEMRKYILRKMF